MKITLSHTEALAIIRKAMRLDDGVVIELINPDEKKVKQNLILSERTAHLLQRANYDSKTAAIKAIRELHTDLGFLDSHAVVTHPQTALDYWYKHHTLTGFNDWYHSK
jgi:hypothetical protein